MERNTLFSYFITEVIGGIVMGSIRNLTLMRFIVVQCHFIIGCMVGNGNEKV